MISSWMNRSAYGLNADAREPMGFTICSANLRGNSARGHVFAKGKYAASMSAFKLR